MGGVASIWFSTTAATRNPTRYDLVERIEELIAEYNAGSLNIDEYLRRLVSLSHDLSEQERRVVTEDMSEEELAIFDLLNQTRAGTGRICTTSSGWTGGTQPTPPPTYGSQSETSGIENYLLSPIRATFSTRRCKR